jgi:non-ribosomal peptide synthase protein (TIGR01720 family)
VRDENAGWRQICLKSAEIPVEVHDLTSLPAPEQQECYAAIALRLQSSLHLETGPTGAAAIFHMRPSERPKLLLTFHHLIMDGVSWRIFLEQLEGAYGDLQSGLPISLPPKATSYHAWVAELTKYAESPAILDQAEYWRTVANTPVRPLPTDCDGENNVGSTANVELEFTKEETARLLQRSSGAAQGSDAYTVLATALVQTLTHWTNDSVLAVDFEGHGRENIVPSVDVSRTIGWFTAIYPVVLRNVNRGTPAEALAETKRILNEVPGRGLGYGLLRYLSPDRALAAELGEGLQPQVAFNYLGQFGGGDDTGTRFAFTTGDTGPARDAGQKRKHLIEVNAIIVGGRLQVYWTYSKNRHRPDMVAELAAAYRRAVSGLLASEPATAKNVADKLSVKDRSALLEQIQKAGAQK